MALITYEPTPAPRDEEESNHVLGTTAEAVYGLDLSGHCTFCNQDCTRLLGYSDAGEIVGQNMHALIHYRRADGTPYPEEECPIFRALQTGERTHVEDEVFWRADGSGFRVEYWSHPARRDGRVVGAVVTFLAVCGRKEGHDPFGRSQKTDPVVQLAGRLADEFGNLATIIYGYGDMVLGSVPIGNPAHELVRRMMAAATRADAMTRKLVVLNRTAVLKPEVVDLRVLVGNLDSAIRRIIGKDIRLAITVAPKPGRVHADPGHMEQVVLELVANARDAMPHGGRLDIEVRNADLDAAYVRSHPGARPGLHVVVAVSDRGYGIDPQTMPRLLETFVPTKCKGTGLGLAIVNRVVKQSGGHVAIASELGCGTTVEVFLPRLLAARGAV
jgi:PAS domain S-box-containing protein